MTTLLNTQIKQLNAATKNHAKQRQIQRRRPHEEETRSQVHQARGDHAALRGQERLHEVLKSLAVSHLMFLTWLMSDNSTAHPTGCWTRITSAASSPRRNHYSNSPMSSGSMSLGSMSLAWKTWRSNSRMMQSSTASFQIDYPRAANLIAPTTSTCSTHYILTTWLSLYYMPMARDSKQEKARPAARNGSRHPDVRWP